jgi:formamidopyrimidine-DNA glycosylase
MPELPEVQTVVNHVKMELIGRKIISMSPIWPKVFDNFNFEELLKSKTNLKIIDVFRRAKFIVIQLEDSILAIHLRMTGKLSVVDDMQLPKHTSAIISLDNQSKLVFEDVRKFGRIYFFKNLDIINSRHGIEPLGDMFQVEIFQKILLSKKRNIKALLLDQSIVVGLGNIYVDESLWMSGIHPNSLSCLIPKLKIKKLHHSIISILTEAIKSKGTTIIDFSVNGQSGKYSSKLCVYGRENDQCLTCNSTIIKLRVCGRGTYVCKICQRKYFKK